MFIGLSLSTINYSIYRLYRSFACAFVQSIASKRVFRAEAYRAMVSVEGIAIKTTYADLPIALEYLVILTAMKQRILLDAGPVIERLQRSLTEVCGEQGKSPEEKRSLLGISKATKSVPEDKFNYQAFSQASFQN